MLMKRFLNRSRKPENKEEGTTDTDGQQFTDLHPVVSATKSTSTLESQDSIHKLQPIFSSQKEGLSSRRNSGEAPKFSFTNDANLNLNPSILNTKDLHSLMTADSDYRGNSMYSQSRKTSSTKQSSYMSKLSQKGSGTFSGYRGSEYGQPLQILEIPEESKEDQNIAETIAEKLHELSEDISFSMNQYNSSIINLTTTVINTIDCFKKFVAFVDQYEATSESESWNINTYNNADLRKVMKVFLNFYDNLLKDDVYIKLKLLLVKNFNDFAATLSSNTNGKTIQKQNIIKPQNFAIGVNEGQSLPNEDIIEKIMKKIASTSISVHEQNGSFIAPIARGISDQLNILCLYFGYPNPNEYHLNLVQSLQDLYSDIHVIVLKNQIDLAASAQASTPVPTFKPPSSLPPNIASEQVKNTIRKFKLPFRNPTDGTIPPISLSLSVENSTRISGTMGGFIYPRIDLKKQPHLESYTNSKFALSCGHVCLDNKDDNMDYPHVSAPLSVLISLYKQALTTQYRKFANQSNVAMIEEKVAYGAVLNQLNEIFPLKKVKVSNSKTEEYEIRNLPKHRFGQIIWGERTLINQKKNKKDEEIENKLSDLAIIKVNKNIQCNQNFLGDDIAFNEYDPALMFDNLYVRAIINLRREYNELDIDEVDSTSDNTNYRGLPVFKYGSTTKYTKGSLNGIKLVYWLDGAIHSSEFIINSLENNTAFAAGGDSGSWILAKLEDCSAESKSKGLGVLGMLHSYDGEHKQFGLFTPMCEILDRLETVTNIKWGVVGVPDKDDMNITMEGTDSETSSNNEDGVSSSDSDGSDDDSEYASGVEDLDGALPPEID